MFKIKPVLSEYMEFEFMSRGTSAFTPIKKKQLNFNFEEKQIINSKNFNF